MGSVIAMKTCRGGSDPSGAHERLAKCTAGLVSVSLAKTARQDNVDQAHLGCFVPNRICAIFGLDPCLSPVAVLGRIGYCRTPDLPGLGACRSSCLHQAFYPRWTLNTRTMREQFGLDPTAIAQNSSKANARSWPARRSAHRPDLLLLDEPSSGLDRSFERDIPRTVIRTVSDEGRTSSSLSLLEEMRRVSITLRCSHGKLCAVGPSTRSKCSTSFSK